MNRATAKIVPERAGLGSAHTRDVYYEYDLRSLQTKARFDSLAGEGITNAYDGFGRLVSSSSDMGGVARTVGNSYDSNGNRIRITHPDRSFFTYDQDGLDRTTLIRENGGDPIASYTYDRASRRARSGWAAATDYSYDPVGRLQVLSHDLSGTARDHVLGFSYNPADQIVTRSASNDAYAWSAAADTSRSYAVNGLNQYTAAGSATFGYDLNGNLASTVNAPWSTAYVYDVENRLITASGTHSAELVYDPLGRLFQVSSGAAVRRLVYDGDALIAEYDLAGNMPHRYIHGNDAKGDDPLVWYDNWNSGWRRGLVADHQGSIIQVADMYGNPIATNSYDPWGLPGGTPAGRFGYTGQAWVPELGLWYYKARFYSPTLGRFLQTDPIGYEDQVNLYAYVGNDPVNKVDFDGNEGKTLLTSVTEWVSDELANIRDQVRRIPDDIRSFPGHVANGTTGLPPTVSGGANIVSGSFRAANALRLGLAGRAAASPANLFRSALQPFGNSALTQVGRALTKHPEVIGATKDTLRQGLRSDQAINRAASNALKTIMRQGVTTTSNLPRYGNVITKQIPGGYGARWYQHGGFIGFINP